LAGGGGTAITLGEASPVGVGPGVAGPDGPRVPGPAGVLVLAGRPAAAAGPLAAPAHPAANTVTAAITVAASAGARPTVRPAARRPGRAGSSWPVGTLNRMVLSVGRGRGNGGLVTAKAGCCAQAAAAAPASGPAGVRRGPR
jgi:hypothetical protein